VPWRLAAPAALGFAELLGRIIDLGTSAAAPSHCSVSRDEETAQGPLGRKL
jgi:hypothetical protein